MMWIFSDLRLRRATMSHKCKKKDPQTGSFSVSVGTKKIRKEKICGFNKNTEKWTKKSEFSPKFETEINAYNQKPKYTIIY